MSLKDGKKGTRTNERIAVGSGERRGEREDRRKAVEVRAGWLREGKGGDEGCTAGGSLFLCLLRL